MSILRTYNLQNPDSPTTNIELTADGGAVISGLATAQNGLHVTGGDVNVTGIVTATTFSGNVETLNIDSVGIITAQSGVHFGLVGSGLTISSVGAGTSMGFFTDGSEALRIDSSGNLRFNSGYGSVATAYGCRAWVNFNGTGTVAIRESGNVSSITDDGTGKYTVNFTTAMPDANYSVATSVDSNGYSVGFALIGSFSRASNNTTTSFRINGVNGSYNLADLPIINACVVR